MRQQITNRLGAFRSTFYRMQTPIDGWQTVSTGTEQDAGPPPTTGWMPYEAGDEWGGRDQSSWFKAKAIVPKEMAGMPVAAILNTGGEGLCYLDGEPHQGLDANRWPVLLTQSAKGGESFELLIEAYANTGVQRFTSPVLAVHDTLAWDFYWDLRTVFETSLQQPDGSYLGVQMLDLVDEAIKAIDLNRLGDVEFLHGQIEPLQEKFRKKLKQFKHSSGDGELKLMSHSHIDVAWLWRLRETRRKVGRTFATVLHYMDQYPEVTFLQSQPQLYEYLEDHYPTLWERVKAKIKEGKWEANGSGWIEQDMNIPSGESHVRQYLFGNRFYRKEFGISARTVWMPDCFGFPHSLPQIMKKAQIDGFATWKLIYNDYQQHPYCYFTWKGLDGTELPAISLPTLCQGDPSPKELKRHWDSFRQKDLTGEFIHVFGHGDGGGGPTTEMFEYVRRQADLAGVPKSPFGSWQDTFDKLHRNIDQKKIPVFNDELYFEWHRGVQTTQARTKRNNRKRELLARDTDFFPLLLTHWAMFTIRTLSTEHGNWCSSTSSTTSCQARP